MPLYCDEEACRLQHRNMEPKKPGALPRWGDSLGRPRQLEIVRQRTEEKSAPHSKKEQFLKLCGAVPSILARELIWALVKENSLRLGQQPSETSRQSNFWNS